MSNELPRARFRIDDHGYLAIGNPATGEIIRFEDAHKYSYEVSWHTFALTIDWCWRDILWMYGFRPVLISHDKEAHTCIIRFVGRDAGYEDRFGITNEGVERPGYQDALWGRI